MKPLDDIKVGDTIVAEWKVKDIFKGIDIEDENRDMFETVRAIEHSNRTVPRIIGKVTGYDLPYIMVSGKKKNELISNNDYSIHVVSNGLELVINAELDTPDKVVKVQRPTKK